MSHSASKVLRLLYKHSLVIGILMVSNLIYAQTPNGWVRKADFAGAFRHGAVGFTIGSKAYVGTGNTGAADLRDFWEYNPVSNTWTQLSDFQGAARSYASGFSIETKGYIAAGTSGITPQRDSWEYDSQTNIWISRANLGGNATARYNAVGFSTGNKGYISTGKRANEFKNDILEFDPVANTWTIKAAFPGFARELAVGFGLTVNTAHKGYISTGYDGITFFNDIWEWDQATNVWTQKADLIGPGRAAAFAFGLGGKGYIGGGYNADGERRDFYEFDPVANAWVSKAQYGTNVIKSNIAFSIDAKGYACTGLSGGTIMGELWEYTPGMTPVSMHVGTVIGQKCLGSTIRVPFTVEGDVNANNMFIIQLSNSMGTFSSPNPSTIGSKVGTTGDTITCFIPDNIVTGNNYKIRVVSTSPNSSLGTPSDIFTISAPPAVSYTNSLGSLCNNAAIQELTGGSPTGGIYSGTGVVNLTQFDPVLAGAGTHIITYTYTSAAGCSASATQEQVVDNCLGTSVTQNNPFSLTAFPNPFIGEVNISYNLIQNSQVGLEIRNQWGNTIKVLENGYQSQGEYTYRFSTEEYNLPKGMYLINLRIDQKTYTSKIVEY